MNKTVKKFNSFKEAALAEVEQYRKMSMQDKFFELLEILSSNSDINETEQRLYRVYRITKLS